MYNKKEMSARGKLVVDSNDPYSFKVGLMTDMAGSKMTFTPSLDVTAPGLDPVRVRGSLNLNGDTELEAELDVNGFTKKPFSTKGRI